MASSGSRARRIDETLTRLTAAHARGADPIDPPTARRLGPLLTRLVVLGLALVVVGTTTAGWVAKGQLDAAVREVAALDEGSVVDAASQVGDRNVLVVATDPGSTTSRRAVAPGAADTVVVAHVPAGGDAVVALSFPSDLEINRPPCERFDPGTAGYTGETVPAQARTPLKTAMQVGGPACVTRVVQQLTGLAITSYIGMNLDRMGPAVEAVSGVEVCVARPVLDDVLGPVVPGAGRNTFDGPGAADFVRATAVVGDPPSNFGRIQRQQQVLAAVLRTAVSGTGLLDIGQTAALRSVLRTALVTDNAGVDEALAVALALQRLDADGVTFAAVPTSTEPNGRGHVELRESEATALFTAVRSDTALPDTAADPVRPDVGPAPGDITVQIINASDRSGLAAGIGDTLRALGFGVGEPGSAEQPTPQTVIRFSPDQAAAAELLADSVPSATTAPDPGSSGVLQLVLGRSFDDVVRAPAEPEPVSDPVPDPFEVPPFEC